MPKSGYDFYLDKCLLPVTPPKLTIKINNTNKTITMIDDGEINILKKAGLDLCQYFGHKKLKVYVDFFNSSSSFCCGVL